MINWLREQRELRVPLHVRRKAWEVLKHSGRSAHHLISWFQKWNNKLKDICVTELEALDQFDINVRSMFGPALTEVIKAEEEHQEKPSLLSNLTCRKDMTCC